jgi:tetratricopeptide (TPR) repeat protein
MVHARLDTFGPEAGRALRAASIFGETFTADGVEFLLGANEGSRVLESIDLLVQGEALTARGSSRNKDFAFRHALLREGSYAMLTEPDRQLGHRLAGEWLLTQGETEAVVLANHFDRGGDRQRAATWYVRAAIQALRGNDATAALSRVEAARASGPLSETLGEANLVAAQAHYWRGDLVAAAENARSAIGCAPPSSVTWFHAIEELIGALGDAGNFGELAKWFALVESQVPGAQEGQEAQVACLSWCGGAFASGGANELAARAIEQAGRIFEQLATRDPWVATRLFYARGLCLAARHDPMQAIRELEMALEASEQARDVRTSCGITGELAICWTDLGNLTLAEELAVRALATARRRSLATVEAFTLPDYARVLFYSGRIKEARAALRAAAALADKHGNSWVSGQTDLVYSELAHGTGEFADAEAQALRAISNLSSSPGARATGLAALARAMLAQNRVSEALETAEEAMKVLEAIGTSKYRDSLVRLMLAEAKMATGDVDGAHRAIGDAWEQLQKRAEKISDATIRESFFTRVPDNAKTLTLAEAWGVAPPREPA